MTKAIMRILGFADPAIPCPHTGMWLRSFDHDAYDGDGFGEFTDDPHQAMTFCNAGRLMEFWQRTSKVRPLRPDLRPNKPLTASSVAIDYI